MLEFLLILFLLKIYSIKIQMENYYPPPDDDCWKSFIQTGDLKAEKVNQLDSTQWFEHKIVPKMIGTL